MGESGICFNCYLRPFLNKLKFIGFNKFQICNRDLDENKLFRVSCVVVLLTVWLLLIWASYISLIDEKTCTELCGGFIYNVNDTSASVTFAKIFIFGLILFAVIAISDAFFSKKLKVQVQQENFDGEIENLFKKRDEIYRWILIATTSLCMIGFISMSYSISFLPMPENKFTYVLCSISYNILLFWVILLLANFMAIIILVCSFWLKRFENIIKNFKNCKKFPNTMKTVLYLEEKKFAELDEMIEIIDESFGRFFTEFIVFAMNFIAGCFYYAMFSSNKERLFFLPLGTILTIVLACGCLKIAEITDKCMKIIDELYIFNTYPMEFEDLIKVITFMKRINGKLVGVYYFNTTAITKEFSIKLISSVWSTFSTLLEFRKITQESYKSKICNRTLFDNLA